MPLLIRPAEARDRNALAEQFLGLNRYENAITGDRRTDLEGADASLASALERVAGGEGVALVAELDGIVVGHLFLVFKQDEPYVREELRPYAYVIELFVRDEARQAGIGTALMREAERLTRERGFSRLMVGVLAGNIRTEQLYARLGFRPHAIEMEKFLGPRQ